MGKSKVTDYIIEYLHNNSISIQWAADAVNIAVDKLKENYEEPLQADEFLELCVLLSVRPEDILQAIGRGKIQKEDE